MSSEKFACYSVGNGDLVKVWSAIQCHQKDNSDGIKNQYLRDKEEDWGRRIRGRN